jgi:hypothetical protein
MFTNRGRNANRRRRPIGEAEGQTRFTTGQARLSTPFLPFTAIGIVRRLLSIADAFLYLALDLLGRTFDLLFAAPRDLAHLALYFAGDIFDGTLDLITIHDLPRCVTPSSKRHEQWVNRLSRTA